MALGSAVVSGWSSRYVRAVAAAPRKMTIDLTCGAIGVRADQRQAIEYAHRFGFESVEAYPQYLADLSEEACRDLRAEMRELGLRWGTAGLPVDFRGNEDRFRAGLEALPRLAAGLERAGARRMNTWISPGHDSLTYLENFHRHARRLREVAEILSDHGVRLGLEYVGTLSARLGRKYSFIHTLAETRDLIEEMGTDNVGFVLDSWHWWMAGDTAEDIRALSDDQVIAVDLNDAPAGLAKIDQQDGRRELPATTGVIPVASFLQALQHIEYSGPVRAEPFNQALREMDNEAACQATITAMQRAFAVLE